MKYLWTLALPLLVLDQLTKWLIIWNIPFGAELPVIPGFFSIVHTTNTGAAFGLFRGNNTFFIALALAAVAVVLFLLWRDARAAGSGRRLFPITRVSLNLLLAGVIGNLIDRLIHGQVIDFLHFYLGAYAWPSFNVADSCICVAAGLLILASFRREKKVAV
jgi:signal peptidase II